MAFAHRTFLSRLIELVEMAESEGLAESARILARAVERIAPICAEPVASDGVAPAPRPSQGPPNAAHPCVILPFAPKGTVSHPMP